MSAASEFAHLHRLPPKEALDYLKGRDDVTLTHSWQDLWQEEHAHQFTVSRLARLDILTALRDGITASVDGDLTRRDWQRDIKKLLKREGWWGEKEMTDPQTGETVRTRFDSARLNLIFDTNTRMAYAAGQWQRDERVKKTHPYRRYITRRDSRVRPAHQAWDNLTLPVDDPWWDTHFPPNDFRCRCRSVTVTPAEYAQRAAAGSIVTERSAERTVEFVNKRTGQVTRAPWGVHPAFAYNPGKAAMRQAAQAQLIGAKIAAAPAALGAAVGQEFSAARIGAGFGEFFDRAFAERKRPRNETRVVGTLRPEWVTAAVKAGVTPVSAEIAVRDKEIAHTFRDAKTSQLPPGWYRNLPEHIKNPKAVLLDTVDRRYPAFLLIYDDAGDLRKKLVVRVNYTIRHTGTLNVVESGKVLESADLKAGIGHGYELVEGEL